MLDTKLVPRVSKDVLSMCPLEGYHHKVALHQGMRPQEVHLGGSLRRFAKGSTQNFAKTSTCRVDKRLSWMFTWRSFRGSTRMSIRRSTKGSTMMSTLRFVVSSTTSSIKRDTLALPHYNRERRWIPNHIGRYYCLPRWHKSKSRQSWFNNWGIHVIDYIWGSCVKNYTIWINYVLGWNQKTKWVGG